MFNLLKPWVEARLHRLHHGLEQQGLKEIAGLKAGRSAAGKIVHREQTILPARPRAPGHRRIRQANGLRHLQALEEAPAHGHWDQLWLGE